MTLLLIVKKKVLEILQEILYNIIGLIVYVMHPILNVILMKSINSIKILLNSKKIILQVNITKKY